MEMVVVLRTRPPVLYLWQHVCSATLNPVSKNKAKALKYVLLICLISAKFELDTLFWITEWHKLANDFKTDLPVFCVSSIFLKQFLFKIRKLSLIKYDVLGHLEKKNQSHVCHPCREQSLATLVQLRWVCLCSTWSSYTWKLLASAFRSVAQPTLCTLSASCQTGTQRLGFQCISKTKKDMNY